MRSRYYVASVERGAIDSEVALSPTCYGGHGQVAVVPVCVAIPAMPQVTSQSTQLVTVQPVAGQVTLQSVLPPQSTAHEVACEHST